MPEMHQIMVYKLKSKKQTFAAYMTLNLGRIPCSMLYATLQVIIYSGDGLTAQQLLKSAASNFDITVTDNFKVK